MIKTVIARAGLLIAGLLIALLLAEGLLRISGQDPLDRVLAVEKADSWNDECFELEPHMGYRYTPGECSTNSLGFPDREVAIAAAPGEKRVLILGDSISADRLFPDFLEQLLPATLGVNTEVINTGTPGYATRNELAMYEHYGAQLSPDLVVLQFCVNDYTGTPFLFYHEGQIIKVRDQEGELWGRSSVWFSRSALYRLFVFRDDLLAPRAGPIQARFPGTEAALLALRDRLEAEGRELLVVIFPYLAPLEEWPKPETAAVARIREVLAEQRIDSVDLTDDYRKADINALHRNRGPEVFAALPEWVQAFGLPDDAVEFLRAQPAHRLKINKLHASHAVDYIHPSFLGHYIAAHRIRQWIAAHRQAL